MEEASQADTFQQFLACGLSKPETERVCVCYVGFIPKLRFLYESDFCSPLHFSSSCATSLPIIKKFANVWWGFLQACLVAPREEEYLGVLCFLVLFQRQVQFVCGGWMSSCVCICLAWANVNATEDLCTLGASLLLPWALSRKVWSAVAVLSACFNHWVQEQYHTGHSVILIWWSWENFTKVSGACGFIYHLTETAWGILKYADFRRL